MKHRLASDREALRFYRPPWRLGKPSTGIPGERCVRSENGEGWDVAHAYCVGPVADAALRILEAAPQMLEALEALVGYAESTPSAELRIGAHLEAARAALRYVRTGEGPADAR